MTGQQELPDDPKKWTPVQFGVYLAISGPHASSDIVVYLKGLLLLCHIISFFSVL